MPPAVNEPILATSLKHPNSKTLEKIKEQAGNLIAWEKGLVLFEAAWTVEL